MTVCVFVILRNEGSRLLIVYVCHPEERRILPVEPWVKILRKSSSERQRKLVILRDEGSCLLTVYVCHPEERRILPFEPWIKILRKRSSE